MIEQHLELHACKAPGVSIDLSPLYNFLRTGGNKQADGKQK